MIKYGGIIEKDKLYYIKFVNDNEKGVTIPLDKLTAELIKRYLAKISTADVKMVKRGNDEEFN